MSAKNRLRVRKLETVGFVDKGDNPGALVTFFKRRQVAKRIVEENGKFCVYDADGKKTGEYNSMAEAQAHTGKRNGTLTKILQKLGIKDEDAAELVGALLVEGAGAAGAPGDGDGTDTDKGDDMSFDVNKMTPEQKAAFDKAVSDAVAKQKPAEPAVPESVTKALEDATKRAQDAETRVAKLEDQREQDSYIAKAKGLGLTADDWATPLRKIAKALTGDEFKKLEEYFKASQEQARVAALYKEIGRGGTGAATDTDAAVAAAVAEVRKAKPELTAEEAEGEVMKNRPDLRNQLERERMARLERHGQGD